MFSKIILNQQIYKGSANKNKRIKNCQQEMYVSNSVRRNQSSNSFKTYGEMKEKQTGSSVVLICKCANAFSISTKETRTFDTWFFRPVVKKYCPANCNWLG